MAADLYLTGEACESRTGGAIQVVDRQKRAGDRLSESAGERAPVFGQRAVAGGCQLGNYRNAGQKFDGCRLAARVGSIGRCFWPSSWQKRLRAEDGLR